MLLHKDIEQSDLRQLIASGAITLGGNAILKTFGTLSCSSGKRMKRENRVFFVDLKTAQSHGFRPCGRCMRVENRRWKKAQNVPV